jgi:predicted amidohydrolase
VNFRLSIVQQPLAWQDAAANRAHFSRVLAPLAGTTDLALLPEMFTSGFTMQPEVHAEAADGATRGWMLQQAQLLDSAVGGSVAVNDQGRFFNRFMLATPHGDLYQYDKRHLFRMGGEHRHYSAGGRAQVFQWRGVRICPLVCYDLRFPVWSRRRAELEYDLLTYSANWPAVRRHAWMTLLRARAIENQAFVAGVNRVGDDGSGMAHAGDSVVVDFAGQPLAELDDRSGVATVSLDLAALRAWRDKFPAHLDADAFILES